MQTLKVNSALGVCWLLKDSFPMAVSPKSLWIIISLVTILFSCTNDMAVVDKIIDPDEEPDLVADNIDVLYSDSARLQMKLVAPLLKQYKSASEQREEFPEGLHVWFYEKTGQLKAEITANWVKHDIATDIWEARGNVVLIDAEGAKLESEQMFWNQAKAIVYSEKYTKITSKNGTIASGDSFWAKQDFSERKLFNKSGVGKTIIYVENEDNKPEE